MKRRDFLKSALIGSTLLSSGLFPRSGKTTAWGKWQKGRHYYRIDAYGHFCPMDYLAKLEELSGFTNPLRSQIEHNPYLSDINERLAMMDDTGTDVTIIIPTPPLETAPPNIYTDPTQAVAAAQFGNDKIAEIVAQHPSRFKWVALLPSNLPGGNYEPMLEELERAVGNGAVGGCFDVSPTLKPPDHDDYMQLYQKAVDLNVPLWMHPSRPATYPDYTQDPEVFPGSGLRLSKYLLFLLLGWLLDESVAQARIAFAGVFNSLPDLKIIVHHKGALVPLFQYRLKYEYYPESAAAGIPATISPPYLDHLRHFYVDTAFNGDPSFETETIKIICDFYGPDHVLFGTDAAYNGANWGKDGVLKARYAVEGLHVPSKEIKNIFSDNILRIIPG